MNKKLSDAVITELSFCKSLMTAMMMIISIL